MEQKTNFLLKSRLKAPTREDVLTQIQSLRGKLSVIIEELECLENDVKIMEN